MHDGSMTAWQKKLKEADIKLVSQGPDTLQMLNDKPDHSVLDKDGRFHIEVSRMGHWVILWSYLQTLLMA